LPRAIVTSQLLFVDLDCFWFSAEASSLQITVILLT